MLPERLRPFTFRSNRHAVVVELLRKQRVVATLGMLTTEPEEPMQPEPLVVPTVKNRHRTDLHCHLGKEILLVAPKPPG
eukprot:9492935-Pyramimonas_sp.AAC.1